MTKKQMMKFGEICREVKITTKDPIADGYERYIGLEHLDSGSLKIKRWGMIAKGNPSFTRVFKKGHILFGKRRPYLKKAAVADFDGICSGDIIVIEPIEEIILPSILWLIFKKVSFWEFAVKTSSGSLSPRTKFSAIREFRLELLDNSKQEALGDISKKLAQVESLNLSLMNTSYSFWNGFLDTFILSQRRQNEDVCIYDPRYGYYPKDWKLIELQQVCDLVIDCKNRTPKFYDDGIPVVRTSNIRNGKINWEGMKFTDENDFKTWTERGTPQAGDLIITREAPIGELCLVPENLKLCMGQRMMLFRPNRELVTPDYLRCVCLSKFFQMQLLALANGSTVGHVRVGELKKAKVLIPSLKLQNKMTEAFNNLEESIHLHEKKSINISTIFEQII